MKYEVLMPGRYYHIYNQGNNKENIFIEAKNYYYFLRLVKKYIVPITEIYAYCLLPNHFHLLVMTSHDVEKKALSQGFSNLFNAYSKAINKTYSRSGSLFKRKFSRKEIKDEEYIKNLVLYIHTNPRYHKITVDFETYLYSSYNAFLLDKPTNISKEYILTLFDGKENFKHIHCRKADIINEILEAYILE